jgi:hypothetical protein
VLLKQSSCSGRWIMLTFSKRYQTMPTLIPTHHCQRGLGCNPLRLISQSHRHCQTLLLLSDTGTRRTPQPRLPWLREAVPVPHLQRGTSLQDASINTVNPGPPAVRRGVHPRDNREILPLHAAGGWICDGGDTKVYSICVMHKVLLVPPQSVAVSSARGLFGTYQTLVG